MEALSEGSKSAPTSFGTLRCREIAPADVEAIVSLLHAGFPGRGRPFWAAALGRMTRRATPPGYPKYGYLLEYDGSPVGTILLLYSYFVVNKRVAVRCNVSSWYAVSDFRSYASILTSYALRNKQVTYFNITPDPKTIPILKLQGYVEYCGGEFICVPAFLRQEEDCKVYFASDRAISGTRLSEWESNLLRDHREYGCISVICRSAGRHYPFVFIKRRKMGFISWAQLAYCTDMEDFIRFAGALGRFLLKQGITMMAVDADVPLKGIFGWYRHGGPKFSKGPEVLRLGDIAYSERAIFGF
jgi:hypothetical protein